MHVLKNDPFGQPNSLHNFYYFESISYFIA